MVQTLDQGTRRARKPYRCGMCGLRIRPRDLYAYQTIIDADRIYTWRDCYWCDRDNIVVYVCDWAGEDVTYEHVVEWADEAIGWPKHWVAYNRHITATERQAARAWVARAAGGSDD